MSDKPLTIGSARTSHSSQQRQVEEQLYYNEDWVVIHPVSRSARHLYAVAMRTACSNDNLVYSQSKRAEIYKRGVETQVKTHCDCSSLVREIVLMGGIQVPDWYTGNMVDICSKYKDFEVYRLNGHTEKLYNGDIIVYRHDGHGHTAIVTHGGQVNFKPKK